MHSTKQPLGEVEFTPIYSVQLPSDLSYANAHTQTSNEEQGNYLHPSQGKKLTITLEKGVRFCIWELVCG